VPQATDRKNNALAVHKGWKILVGKSKALLEFYMTAVFGESP
jgi:hypothetical protein